MADEREGPDMTPQGLADAVDDLVRGLPVRARRRREDSTWQQVLALQLLDRAIEEHPVFEAALRAALHRTLYATPALYGAVEAAFGHEARPTPFGARPLGRAILSALHLADQWRAADAFAETDDEDEGAPDPEAP